ncbi:UDP-N-acetylmuramate dehydrogenase [Vibrio furnissii]|uniref:UDP-N-acetylmuramate dehydrogenase n=1 Tax=Vibrio furnissii TaxID=29494 RepID=UPI0001B91FE0|nr:UDP-N-acetylmuramate dehydrogenase [Vibrio furnissii]EEX39528.1 UDP-N-acetylenolpyruvoylglucosamine reductase [Vibrio furnissii CIP 102972]QDC91883.1 UDP-N-acetylmuramate dehydrogenase [Vibrio furnissii]UON49477.1 UDP-N-acetylmuramate dehydrogenase [Vibrio furnissii]SUP43058.1 UDP-N-acetylmuramate dehydrogenase [Vibrio furnissii]
MVKLADKSYWKVGGECSSFFDVGDEIQLKNTLKNNDLSKLIVIGNATNLLFDSKGYDGVVIKLNGQFNQVSFSDSGPVEVGAAVWVPGLVRQLMKRGKGSLDHCVGIPATVGGLVAMNGGSQRKSISENIISVKVMDYDGNIHWIDREECLFSYRKSLFLDGGLIILSVILDLVDIEPNSNRIDLLKILKERRLKFPRKEPNCGSVFKSSVELYNKIGPPGFVIESLGLKGLKFGDAEISEKHANFIVNKGHAKSDDIISLVKHINLYCKNEYNIEMEAEAIYLSKSGERYLLHCAPNEK